MSILIKPSKSLLIKSINLDQSNKLGGIKDKNLKNKKSFKNIVTNYFNQENNINHHKNLISIKKLNLNSQIQMNNNNLHKINNYGIDFVRNDKIHKDNSDYYDFHFHNTYKNNEVTNMVSSEVIDSQKSISKNISKINTLNDSKNTNLKNNNNSSNERSTFNSPTRTNSKKLFSTIPKKQTLSLLKSNKEMIGYFEKNEIKNNTPCYIKNSKHKEKSPVINFKKNKIAKELKNYKNNRLTITQYNKEKDGFFILKKDFFLKNFLKEKTILDKNGNLREEKIYNPFSRDDLKIHKDIRINSTRISSNIYKYDKLFSPIINDNIIYDYYSNSNNENNFIKSDKEFLNKNLKLGNKDWHNKRKNQSPITREIVYSKLKLDSNFNNSSEVEKNSNENNLENQDIIKNNTKENSNNKKYSIRESFYKEDNLTNNQKQSSPLHTYYSDKNRQTVNDKLFTKEIEKSNLIKNTFADFNKMKIKMELFILEAICCLLFTFILYFRYANKYIHIFINIINILIWYTSFMIIGIVPFDLLIVRINIKD